jgi:hypothetical protein
MTARTLNDSTRCLLVGTPRTYFRAVINKQSENQKQPGDEFRPGRWSIRDQQSDKSVSVGAESREDRRTGKTYFVSHSKSYLCVTREV